jgi:hypothetical protein
MDDTWLGNPVNPIQYPGVDVGGVLTATYTEGLFFGYRWYDAQGTAPLWPFGECDVYESPPLILALSLNLNSYL